MVPMLQLGHAGEGVEIVSHKPQPVLPGGFNWATPVKAWRYHHNSTNVSLTAKLQLGHAGEGVEMSTCRTSTILLTTLQLGHAGEGVEIATIFAALVGRTKRFNWATPVKAWR